MMKLMRRLNSFFSDKKPTPQVEQNEDEGTPGISDEDFIRLAYQLLLSREADSGGFDLAFKKIAAGEMSRDEFILTLIQSKEFEKKYHCSALEHFFIDMTTVASSEMFIPFVKKDPTEDVQLNELTNPSKWIDPHWREFGLSLEVASMSLQYMHRKNFEWVQTIYGLSYLGKLCHDSVALGVGTGHECIVYWMARNLKMVFATDLFREKWAYQAGMEGDPAVIRNPEKYQPFQYPKERLQFLPMNGCYLAWKDNSFDIVFTLSSIEHFGGKDYSALAMEEMGRVLKPGGIAVIATEFILNGKKHPEFFDENDLLEYVIKPSRMKLIQNISFTIPRVFLERPLRIPSEICRRPHLSLTDGNTVWTSIVLFLEKSGVE